MRETRWKRWVSFFIFPGLMELVDVRDLGSRVERRRGFESPIPDHNGVMLELVDNAVLKTVGVIRAGSSPVDATKKSTPQGEDLS